MMSEIPDTPSLPETTEPREELEKAIERQRPNIAKYGKAWVGPYTAAKLIKRIDATESDLARARDENVKLREALERIVDMSDGCAGQNPESCGVCIAQRALEDSRD